MTVTEQLSALSAILTHRDLHSLFQPIVSLSDRRILGYEALTRGPSNSALHSPVSLFAVARQAGRLSELELACRESACRRFSQQKLEGKLFLNISPESLLEPSHPPGRTLQLLQRYGIPPSQVVIGPSVGKAALLQGLPPAGGLAGGELGKDDDADLHGWEPTGYW